MNENRGRLFAFLAWLQLITSLFLAATIVWGYLTYQSSLGQFFHSIADSVGAVSSVVARTAETVEARRDLINQSAQMLDETRKLINELRNAAANQAQLAPQYAGGLQSAASVTWKLSGLVQQISNAMDFSVPSPDIRWDGMKPVFIMTRPMGAQAIQANAIAQDIKNISTSMTSIATTISRDGQNLSVAVIATSDQALKVIAEAEKTLGRINTEDLPNALNELKRTSHSLEIVRAQVDTGSKVGVVLLVAGLLLAVWCFLNSLGALTLARWQLR
jgi:uncharacterized phage infection (PIP) family protein YhgE